MTITPNSPAKDLPIYDKAVARYPHLAYAPDAKTFCLNLSCCLAMVPGIKFSDYFKIGAVANGCNWPE
nr:MAG TPA: hypothetical protein [Caudoviricetes sp.]